MTLLGRALAVDGQKVPIYSQHGEPLYLAKYAGAADGMRWRVSGVAWKRECWLFAVLGARCELQSTIREER